MTPPNRVGLNAFLGLAGFVLTVAAFFSTINGDMSSPYFTISMMVLAIVGTFMLGYNMRDMLDKLRDFTSALMEQAARKAVDEMEPRLKDMMDERIEACFEMDGNNLNIVLPSHRGEDHEK